MINELFSIPKKADLVQLRILFLYDNGCKWDKESDMFQIAGLNVVSLESVMSMSEEQWINNKDKYLNIIRSGN